MPTNIFSLTSCESVWVGTAIAVALRLHIFDPVFDTAEIEKKPLAMTLARRDAS
jgi:hypothetical protein